MDLQCGWKKDPYNKKAWMHKLTRMKVPDVTVLDQWLPIVRDQGHVGSCVGFSIGANLTSWQRKLGFIPYEWFSPTWIYNGARYLDGTLDVDVGCYPEDALNWVSDKGCLLEQFWPYNPAMFDPTSPPSSLEPEAAKWPLVAYYRVGDGAAGICDTLSQGYYVSIGNPWYAKWLPIGLDNVLPEIKVGDSIVGGHETCLYGYDIPNQLFYGLNSWGPKWGKQGTFLMPFSAIDVFKQVGGYDAHYVVVNWNQDPEPPKPPEPEPPEPEDDDKCFLTKSYVGFGNTMSKLLGSRIKISAQRR